jgi:hypothetical protein
LLSACLPIGAAQKKSRPSSPADEARDGLWKAVTAFEDPTIPRKELLTRLEEIIKKLPESDRDSDNEDTRFSSHPKLAREYAALLKQMIKEDEEYAKKPRKPMKEMTTNERVADLIFNLREQNGRQWSQPGSCDIFCVVGAGGGRVEDSPAHQLVDIGYDAVPQLIEALEDKRLTRSVGFHRNFYFSHHVLRVGDCSLAVLERIAGRSFWEGKYTNAGMIKDGQEKETRKRVQVWWDEYQRKGEKQMLLEGTETGDWNSARQADRLLKRYPSFAFEALVKGMVNAKDEWPRVRLADCLTELGDERAVPVLRKELNGPLVASRVAAARGLLKFKNEEGVAAIIDQWKKTRDVSKYEDRGQEYITFLASCNRVNAVQALAEDFKKRPVDIRLSIVEALSESQWDDRPAESPAVKGAVYKLLAEALTDTEQRKGMGGTWDGKRFSDPRICDFAAHILSRRWNNPNAFDLAGNLQLRNRQRIEMLNVWRAEHGEPALPLPPKDQ